MRELLGLLTSSRLPGPEGDLIAHHITSSCKAKQEGTCEVPRRGFPKATLQRPQAGPFATRRR
jgi:hypothetical protein